MEVVLELEKVEAGRLLRCLCCKTLDCLEETVHKIWILMVKSQIEKRKVLEKVSITLGKTYIFMNRILQEIRILDDFVRSWM